MRCLVIASFLCAGAAFAQSEKVAVVPLSGLGVDDATLEHLDHALRGELSDLGIDVAGRDKVKAAMSSPCEGQLDCLVRVGAAVGASEIVTGSAGLAGDELHVTLKLIDVGLKIERKSLDAAAPADQAERRVRETAMKLVRPERYNQSGSIELNTPLQGADIVVDGVPRGRTPLFGPLEGLAPGRREVEVRYAGAKTWHGFIDVAFDQPYQLDVVLKDGAVAQVPHGTAVSVAVPDHPRPGKAKSPQRIPVLAVVGAGVGVAGVAALVGAGFAFASASDAFQKGHDQGEASSGVINQNLTMSVAYYALLAAGVGALGGGATLAAVSLLGE